MCPHTHVSLRGGRPAATKPACSGVCEEDSREAGAAAGAEAQEQSDSWVSPPRTALQTKGAVPPVARARWPRPSLKGLNLPEPRTLKTQQLRAPSRTRPTGEKVLGRESRLSSSGTERKWEKQVEVEAREETELGLQEGELPCF